MGYVARGGPNDGNDPHSWFEDGNAVSNPHEIVAEWVDPKRIQGWMVIDRDEDGDYKGRYVHKTQAMAQTIADRDSVACIEIDCLEGEGLK
ncbi:hypothetical protein [Bradyrhizobium sp. S3.12.5]|uniref:hypothetical protein n=1 Tax=Bradyrhizobium sp. S3.12.5 TaxID=3156386 RepID=UPI003399E019